MKTHLDNIGFDLLDLVKYIKAYAPNLKKEDKKDTHSFYIISLIDTLLNIDDECDSLVYKAEKIHRAFLNDIQNLTVAFMVTLRCDVKEIKHKEIQEKVLLFSKLTSYSKNPLEPLLKLLIKESKYKKIISNIITGICKGDHISVKLELHELTTLKHKGDKLK